MNRDELLYIIYNVCASLALGVALLLCACADDGAPATDADGDLLQVASLASAYTDRALTRADGAPDGYEPLAPQDGATIGLFVTVPGEPVPSLQELRYLGDGKWQSLARVKRPDNYIYGFMPARLGHQFLQGTASYDQGVEITLTSLDAVSAEDVCVVVGVQGVANATDTKDVKLGQFYYEKQAKDHNFMHLLLDHLYAALRVQLQVDGDYAALRTIKLKKMELATAAASTVSAVVTLTPNTTGANPATVSYTPTDGTVTATLFEGDAELSDTQLTTVQGYFVPVSTVSDNALTLTTTYDVCARTRRPPTGCPPVCSAAARYSGATASH